MVSVEPRPLARPAKAAKSNAPTAMMGSEAVRVEGGERSRLTVVDLCSRRRRESWMVVVRDRELRHLHFGLVGWRF